MHRTVGVNLYGLRVGEDHPNSRLTDTEVELIRRLHDEGMSYPDLAEKFEVSHHCIGRICRFERRAQLAEREKRVHVPPA
jgi:Mor family transcriptional regulator